MEYGEYGTDWIFYDGVPVQLTDKERMMASLDIGHCKIIYNDFWGHYEVNDGYQSDYFSTLEEAREFAQNA